MVILWGPMTGYITSQSPEGSYTVIPMQSAPDIKFDFSMSMAVRYGDNQRKALLESLIDKNFTQIQAIIKGYNIPVLPIPEQHRKDDD